MCLEAEGALFLPQAAALGENLHEGVAVEEGEAAQAVGLLGVAGIVGAHVLVEGYHGPAVGGAMGGKAVAGGAQTDEAGNLGEHAGIGAGAEDADVGLLQLIGVAGEDGGLTALEGVGEGRVALERHVLVGNLQAEGIAGRVGGGEAAGVLQRIDVVEAALDVLGAVGKVVVEDSEQALAFRVVRSVARREEQRYED